MREVAIVAAVRTAIGKGGRGSLKDVRPDTLAAAVIKEAVIRAKLKPADIEDVVLGCAMPEAEQGMNVARIASLLAGLPDTSSAMTVNRFCSSGLNAVADVAKAIMVGEIDIGVGGGVESMSLVPMGGHRPSANPELMERNPNAYAPMGITAENVAKKFEVSRADQDAFALESHKRAVAAIDGGKFAGEIVPVEIDVYGDDGKKKRITFATDEGPRRDTSPEGLAKLKPAFDKDGTVTAGNSSQVSDGAAAVVLVELEKAKTMGLPILAKFKAFATAGVAPELMGIGPIPAVKKLLDKAGLKVSDIDVFELNEAFASQSLAVIRQLGLDVAKVNPNGGAIALGHPLGCTGARQIATLLPEMKRRGAKRGVVTMCIGGGMGAAGLIEAD
ncbi:MAG: thiolase family protein [Deltaproteobacteria bacterium]|nr:thiolase family protein [Deltaproteobacteria bacterium]